MSRAGGAPRVLFLCTGNSARSQMAEALMRALSRDSVEAYSAGSDPRPLHPNAVRAMREAYGIDISGQAPKHLKTLDGMHFDQVISLCDRVCAAYPQLPGQPATVAWPIANPATGGADEATYPQFRKAAAEIETRVARLLALIDPLGAPFPETDKEEAMNDAQEMVSVRYMVDDVAAAVSFYTTVLGFEVLTSFPPAFADVARGRLRLLLSGPASSAGRPMPDGAKPGPGGWNRIHLIVDDIEAEVARLRGAGASFRNDILSGPGGKQILLNDPAGNVIELFQPAARAA